MVWDLSFWIVHISFRQNGVKNIGNWPFSSLWVKNLKHFLLTLVSLLIWGSIWQKQFSYFKYNSSIIIFFPTEKGVDLLNLIMIGHLYFNSAFIQNQFTSETRKNLQMQVYIICWPVYHQIKLFTAVFFSVKKNNRLQMWNTKTFKLKGTNSEYILMFVFLGFHIYIGQFLQTKIIW